MRVFEFQDHTPIMAFVIAHDPDDATEFFEEYVLDQGGDPDDLLWGECRIKDLSEDEQAAINEALAVGRAGVVARRGGNQFVFVVPLGLGEFTFART